MKKRFFVVFMLIFALVGSLFAQERSITGTVTSAENGLSLPGVNVLVKGTGIGTITDAGGQYSIAVPSDAQVLGFSFIGMQPQEVAIGSSNVIDVVLQVSVEELEEIVVTALGIRKSEKSIGYSVTQVSGDDFVEARENNVANSLSGKVAGVSASSMATGPSGSSRVIIRGNTSLSAPNQPLYVVDGIPINNAQLGAAGMWGGADWGDGISSLSPDNIETISVLKGNAAAALYGSRASNGVILITTRQGYKRKGLGVEFTTNFVAERQADYTDFQKEYGSGDRGLKPTDQNEAIAMGLWSWGAKLDGTSVIQYDGVSRPYSYAGDNNKAFFRTGHTWVNTLALTGGNDTHSFRLSASYLDNEGILPNNSMDRMNISLNVNGKYGKRFTASGRIEYIDEGVKNRVRTSARTLNPTYTVYSLPPSISVLTFKGPTDKLGADEDGMETKFSDPWSNNPYWCMYQAEANTQKDRIMGNLTLKYDIFDWLYVQARAGLDWYTLTKRDLIPYGTQFKKLGEISESTIRVREPYMDFMVGWDYSFGDIGFSGFAGGNMWREYMENYWINANTLYIPFFHHVSNGQAITSGLDQWKKGINSLYGMAEISFRNYLFLNGTVREDWFSTLDGKGILYPSIGLSWVFSDTFDLPSWWTFGKFRTSWAQVGGGAFTPYHTLQTYSLIGEGHLGYATGRITQYTVPSTTLMPYTSNEFEFGVDIRFLHNRLDIDLAYYNRETIDDILMSGITTASGYLWAYVNVGEVTNKGFELLINAGIVRKQNWSWDVSFNFANNKNNVVKLLEGVESMKIGTSRTQNAFIYNVVGHPFGAIMGYTYRTDDQGRVVYDAAGLPMKSTDLEVVGNGAYPTIMGLNNSFTFKNFYLNFLIDIKLGADIYSVTNAYAYWYGNHKNTLVGRETGLDISGVDESGAEFSTHIDANDVQDYYGRISMSMTTDFVQDASFAKLRQLTLGYNIPASVLSKTPLAAVNVSLVGRNLLLLWSKTENVDPESNYNPGKAQGLEMFGVPNTRTLGVNLSLEF